MVAKKAVDISYRRKFCIQRKEFLFFDMNLLEPLKNSEACRVPSLVSEIFVEFSNLFRDPVTLKLTA
jgi:hypothetical protein